MLKRPFPVLVACLLMACSDDPSPLEPLQDFTYALATNSCGPADGGITVVYMATSPFHSVPPSAPYLQVHLPKSLSAISNGSVFPVSESFADANVWFHGSGIERTANRGEVGVTSTSSATISTLVHGYVDLGFTDGFRLRGTFIAAWLPRQIRCG